MSSLPEIFRRIVSFLEGEKLPYLVIGGLASSVHGYPRMTQDVDICLSIAKERVGGFLRKARKRGFRFDEEEELRNVESLGVFKMGLGDFHIDFIILSTEFEKAAISRSSRLTIFGVEAPLPTPEDLILLKVIPNRPIDVADMENIARRYSGRLDRRYIELWAQRLSDEAEDMRIHKDIMRLLNL